MFLRCLLLLLLLAPAAGFSSVFGTVKGIVHDPQHRPIKGAEVLLSSAISDWKQTAITNDEGLFQVLNVPVGDYRLNATAAGFAQGELRTTVTSGIAQDLHFQ